TRCAGHAPDGATADAKLTFKPDHQAGAGQYASDLRQTLAALTAATVSTVYPSPRSTSARISRIVGSPSTSRMRFKATLTPEGNSSILCFVYKFTQNSRQLAKWFDLTFRYKDARTSQSACTLVARKGGSAQRMAQSPTLLSEIARPDPTA